MIPNMSISPLDQVLAEKLCPSSSKNIHTLLSYLVFFSRQGEISLNMDPSSLRGKIPEGENLLVDFEELKENLPNTLVYEEGHLYLQKHYHYYEKTQLHLKRLLNQTLEPIAISSHPDLTPSQQEGVRKALLYPVTFLTGGPGTGKTHTAAKIIEAFKDKEVILTAPTGKAASHLAKKLSSLGSIRSGTLHSFLQKEETVLLADLILVDESSMIDAELFGKLLSAIPEKTRLVLIGDPYQLPPVGVGRFFAECMQKVSAEYVTHLSHSHRTENLHILQLAKAALEGRVEEIAPFLEPLSSSCIEESLSFFPTEQTPVEALALFSANFRILSSIRQGPFGVEAVNAKLLQRLIPQEGILPIPILITRNDYSLDLYNGDTGFLIKHFGREGKNYALFLESGRQIPESALPPFEIAYCLSIHKSQGSEYDKVLLLLPEGSEHFGREILYTGITRAKKELTVCGTLSLLYRE